jgi:predicted nucleic acid-binding protein
MFNFDTNILIDYLNGKQLAKEALDKYQPNAMSIISYLEVMVGTTKDNKAIIKEFLDSFEILNIQTNIADEVIAIRNNLKIKLPDAIILATAKTHNAKLITRNTKDFNSLNNVIIPYQL